MPFNYLFRHIFTFLLVFKHHLIHFSFKDKLGLLSALGSSYSCKFSYCLIICLMRFQNMPDDCSDTWCAFTSTYLFIIIFLWFFIEYYSNLAKIFFPTKSSTFGMVPCMSISFCFPNNAAMNPKSIWIQIFSNCVIN